MNKTYKFPALWMMCLMLFSCLSFTACNNGDDEDTNQYKGGVSLNVFGPSPVARGGVLRFLGSGMDKVTAVVIPGCDGITEIEVISDTEIRVTVPQTAQPGLIVLKTPKGDITTKTELNYTEPIALETFAPEEIKPGNELTITGEYLNLIQEIIFTDEVTIEAADFVSQSRKEIKVIVPDSVQTGKFILSDGAEILNWIYSDGELKVVLPSVEVLLDLTGKKPGDIITVMGKDFDLVKKVQMPNGDEVEFELETVEEGQVIRFVLPENMTDGTVVIIPASGIKVAIGTIGMALPSDVKATPATGLRAGDVITLRGVNMELVTTVTFPGVEEAVKPNSQSAAEVKVTMPAAAISGDLLLNTSSGNSVPVSIATLKPEFASYVSAEVSLGSDVIIQGKNLDLVVKVAFTGGAEVETKAESATKLTVTMPTMNAETGVLNLYMANGETVELPKITINAPEFCYIPVLPDEEEEIKAGTVCQIGIANSDNLKEVQVDGTSVQYIVAGDLLYFNIPQSAGKSSVVKLISSNGEVEYAFSFIPATEVEIVLMNTLTDLGSWDEPRVYITGDKFKNLPVSEAKLRIVFAQKEAWGQVQINDGSWNNDGINFPEIKGATLTTDHLSGKDVTEIELTMDATLITRFAEKGIVMQGENWIISKVSIKYEQSLEIPIWKGEFVVANWNGFDALAWGGYDWSTVKVGQIVTFYYTLDTSADYWQMRVAKGDGWGALTGTTDPYDLTGTASLAVKLTQDMKDELVNSGGLLLSGHGYTINKITIL